MKQVIRVGTRGSILALKQTEEVVAALQDIFPSAVIRVVTVQTKGDMQHDVTFPGTQGMFVRELEEALLQGSIDIAVHSLKDLPTTSPPGLIIAAILPRKDPRDCLVSRSGQKLLELPPGSSVGTGSPRRAVQILKKRPDIHVVPLRGNVTTRMARMREGRVDALVLAYAGLLRLGLEGEVTEVFDPWNFVPAPSQGVIACETRCGEGWEELLAPLHHPETAQAVGIERLFLTCIGGGCQKAVGAFAEVQNGWVRLVGMLEGKVGWREGPLATGETMVQDLAQELGGKR
jgi:hydroxymethylbilane synthase